MGTKGSFILTVLLIACFCVVSNYWSSAMPSAHPIKKTGAVDSGSYTNLFADLMGKSEIQVNAKVDDAFRQLFCGDEGEQRVYYPVGSDMAYIEDVLNQDIRTEGMSYGMMIAVQLDKKTEFDRLWKWAKTRMQHQSGPRRGYFAWHCRKDGTIIDANSASDGEEWIVTALFFASARWGNGEGLYNYRAEAQAILDAMLGKEAEPENDGTIKNMFNRNEEQVVFVPFGRGAEFTDPSYHLPHYYELWARWADKENSFWSAAASTSRRFLKETVHPVTGLAPDYAHFDGRPVNPWNSGSGNFRYDAWRVAMNVAVDYVWFSRDDWAVSQSNRLLRFFHSQGMGTYSNLFTLDGKKLTEVHSPGLVAMNAVACLAATDSIRNEFVEEFWNAPIPSGPYRYYDGLLAMLALLQVSGRFRVYNPAP